MNTTVYATPLREQTLHAVVIHRMVTVEQLHRLLTPHRSLEKTRQRLRSLRDDGLVAATSIRTGERGRMNVWHATPTGVDRAMADPDLHRRYIPRPKTNRNLIAHTLAVNEVGVAFVEHARNHPGHECDLHNWEHEVAHSLGGRDRRNTPSVITDAVLSYTIPHGSGATLLRRFVELDRGTEPTHTLFEKLRRYAQYHAYRPATPPGAAPYWTQRYAVFPPVAVVIGANPDKSAGQLDRRLDTLLALAAADEQIASERLAVMIARFEDVISSGPGEAVWRMPGQSHPVTFTGA